MDTPSKRPGWLAPTTGAILLIAIAGLATFAPLLTCPQCLGGQLVEDDEVGPEGWRFKREQLISCSCCRDRRQVSLLRKLTWHPESGSLPANVKIIFGVDTPKNELAIPKVPHREQVSEKTTLTIRVIQDVCASIDRYKLDQGKYPDSWRDLISRPSGIAPNRYPPDGYIKAFPKDAWDNYLLYRVPGAKGNPFEVASFGADGVQGGVGEAQDIWSYDIYTRK